MTPICNGARLVNSHNMGHSSPSSIILFHIVGHKITIKHFTKYIYKRGSQTLSFLLWCQTRWLHCAWLWSLFSSLKNYSFRSLNIFIFQFHTPVLYSLGFKLIICFSFRFSSYSRYQKKKCQHFKLMFNFIK
jgi:hypothetical protein